ncbi:MAG: c-type cytochrome [Acidobacteriota bacterium]|nr:c-type cytochrome [Acidobacteriota bacterium]
MSGLLLMSGALSAQAPKPATVPVPAGNAENGRRLFMDNACYYCHGTVGQGGLAAVGPRIALIPRSLDSFRAYVRRPTARMSAYSEAVLSDVALADIYAYLRSLPAAKPASEIPLLDRLRRPGER